MACKGSSGGPSDCTESVEQLRERIKEECSKGFWLFRGLRKEFEVGKDLLPAAFRGDHPLRRSEERLVFDDFKRQAVRLQTPPAWTDPDWLALAQHHGLTTRVLDWTENPLVALFFALNPTRGVAGAPRIWGFPVDASDIIVREGGECVALPASVNKEAIEKGQRTVIRDLFNGRGHAGRTLLFRPEPLTTRIVAQQGWLMLFQDRKEGEEGDPIPFEKNGRYKDELTYWDICPNARDNVNAQLVDLGIDKPSLFPDLDNLCESLNKKRKDGAYRGTATADSADNDGGG